MPKPSDVCPPISHQKINEQLFRKFGQSLPKVDGDHVLTEKTSIGWSSRSWWTSPRMFCLAGQFTNYGHSCRGRTTPSTDGGR